MSVQGCRTANENRGFIDAELEVGSGLKTEFLSVQHWLAAQGNAKLTDESGFIIEYKVMPRELPQEQFHSNRAEPTQNAGELERRDAADAEHVDRLRNVAKHQRARLHGAP